MPLTLQRKRKNTCFKLRTKAPATRKLPAHNLYMVARDVTSENSDLTLMEIQFPWRNKYKMSDIVAASSLRSQPSFLLVHKTDKFSTKFSFFTKEKHRWDHSDPECLFQLLMVLNQPC